jgi:hypothetical protein
MQFLRNTALTLATGYVLFFFSERLFWTVFKPGDRVGDLVVTWLAYSVLAYVLLAIVRRFRVRTADAAFVAGACYGWLTEGTLVGTLYGTEPSAPFPLSLLVTGVSWHALLSVWVGWYFLPRALSHPRPWPALAWSTGLGLFWGTWATFLWRETPPVVVPVGAFAAHALAVATLLIAAYRVRSFVGAGSFRPRPLGMTVSLLALGVFYAQQVKSLGLRPLLILPALLGFAAVALWAGRPPEPDAEETAASRPAPARWMALLAMPLVATATYALLWRTPHWDRVPVAQAVMYWLTAPLSFGVLIWAVARLAGRAVRRRTASCG